MKLNKKSFFIIVILIIFFILYMKNISENNKGKIYFDVPASWEKSYAYVIDENNNELLGKWPGKKLKKEKDYIYYFCLDDKVVNDNENLNIKINFNNGKENVHKYSINTEFYGYDKIYNITKGIGEYEEYIGEWLDYNENISFGKIPSTNKKIKNVIYMIGDGMGENHIKAGEIYKEEKLNIQKLENSSYVKTASISTVTDSAASATALFTGNKTENNVVGLDKNRDKLENLFEYSKNKYKMKVGIACTQILCHATPASFSVHNINRCNYNKITLDQIESNIDIMFGGGRYYFEQYESEMNKNNYVWINNFDEINNIDKNNKIIATLANETMGLGYEENRIDLANLTNEALKRLENDNGFVLMVEGSDIDSASHSSDMKKMITELVDFDDAVKVAKEYVDKHSDTLLVVTADHETGGLILDDVKDKSQLTDELFTSNGSHTEENVLVYAYGVGAEDLTRYDVIDNTSIFKFIKQGIENEHN